MWLIVVLAVAVLVFGLVFEGHLPRSVRRASLSFTSIYGGPDSITVPDIRHQAERIDMRLLVHDKPLEAVHVAQLTPTESAGEGWTTPTATEIAKGFR